MADKKKKEETEEIEEEARPVTATAKYVRMSARKVRLVADTVRGKQIADAQAALAFSTKAAAKVISKVISSAVANAENNHDLNADELFVSSIFVNEGPTLKRYRPRAMGRAGQIRKRSSHVTVKLDLRREG